MCTCNAALHAKRRAVFVQAMATRGEDSVAIFPAPPVFPRNNDVDHDFRQDSDLFYMTGFAEPQSVLVMGAKDQKSTLFVRPRDPEREVWDGPRAGVDGAKVDFGAEE